MMSDSLPRRFVFRSEEAFDVLWPMDVQVAFGQRSKHYRAHVTHVVGEASGDEALREMVERLVTEGKAEVVAVMIP
ncbi:MAG: hypothetical protein ACREJ5_17120 [Geminicoccaceae bacterium]